MNPPPYATCAQAPNEHNYIFSYLSSIQSNVDGAIALAKQVQGKVLLLTNNDSYMVTSDSDGKALGIAIATYVLQDAVKLSPIGPTYAAKLGAKLGDILTDVQLFSLVLGETIAISWGRDTTILMNHASDIDLIMRDVSGARRPDLKIIGPFPPVEISDEDRRLSAEAAAEDQKQAIESTNRWEQARREIRDAVKKSPAMERNQEIWEQLQQDLRSEFDSVPRILEALFSVANDCARLMQAGIQAGRQLDNQFCEECLNNAEKICGVDFNGTLFGMTICIIKKCWNHTSSLKCWERYSSE